MTNFSEDVQKILTKTYPEKPLDFINEVESFIKDGLSFAEGSDFYYKINWDKNKSVIKILAKDCPFIIDSILILAKNLELVIEQIVHFPIVATRDDNLVLKAVEPFNPNEISFNTETVIFLNYSQLDSSIDLEFEILKTLKPLIYAVSDWFNVQQELSSLWQGLALIKAEDIAKQNEYNYKTPNEVVSFLKWLVDGGFVFLGLSCIENKQVSKSFGIFKAGESYQNFVKDDVLNNTNFYLFDTTQSHHRCNIHKDSFFDIVRIQKFENLKPVGEYRIYGLFTTKAYKQDVFTMPLVKNWISGLLEETGFLPHSYNWKEFVSFANSIPRETLFDIESKELKSWAKEYLDNKKLGKNSVFVRLDKSKRFYEIILACVQDVSQQVQSKITNILSQSFSTDVEAECFNASEVNHAIIKFTAEIQADNLIWSHEKLISLKNEILLTASDWDYELKLETSKNGDYANHFKQGFFSQNYKNTISPKQAYQHIKLISQIDSLGGFVSSLNIVNQEFGQFVVEIISKSNQITLDYIVPILRNFKIKVISSETFTYTYNQKDPLEVTIKHLFVKIDKIDFSNFVTINNNFSKLLNLIMMNKSEDGILNSLTITPSISLRHLTVLRAIIKYLHQARFQYSKRIVGEALVANPDFTKNLINYFEAKFNPSVQNSRHQDIQSIEEGLNSYLAAIANQTSEHVLNGVLKVFKAIVRTNFYLNKEEISFKIKSTMIPFLPKPVPFVEIFVYSADFEAIHLRGGKVARGGIRWSDRVEDFRTEVLGLVKAQTVKNAVIVPVGSKGGFVIKADTSKMSRDENFNFGKACYERFISSCLDITDNFINGNVIKPNFVLEYDGDDPYFVVAADKGTATFSDTANAVSQKYNFWLGDAFASGGSNGYDHKKMGITAKGAWVAAKRHFMELGMNPEEKEFTCVAIGDMSGDVFGNGMLRSKTMKLIAAFNHIHIFIDPNPKPLQSYEERVRMFNLPRSTWMDYDKTKMSQGGAVYSRLDAECELTPEIQQLFGLETSKISPNDLIKKILTYKADLLWNGGIGTYFKSKTETNEDVGDKANDGLRINGEDLKCKIIAEGGNLGFTQLARIEAARASVALNTDAMDNSAGVDCSDHEVNIKILLNSLVASGKMTNDDRNTLLADMTQEVDHLVLMDNYHQTQAISIIQDKNQPVDELGDFMEFLVKEKLLDRENEFLPSEDVIKQYKSQGLNLTRPELCVLFGYTKMYIYSLLHHNDFINDPYLESYILKYFPSQMAKKFEGEVKNHQLKNEIIATCITNEFVNRLGITFAYKLHFAYGFDFVNIIKAFIFTKDTMDCNYTWNELESLDFKSDWQKVSAMHSALIAKIEDTIVWVLTNIEFEGRSIEKIITPYKAKLNELPRDYIANSPTLAMSIALELVKNNSLDSAKLLQAFSKIAQEINIDIIKDLLANCNSQNQNDVVAIKMLEKDLLSLVVTLSKACYSDSMGQDFWITNNKKKLNHVSDKAIELSQSVITLSSAFLLLDKLKSLV
jgi:glutamate dehydrogenase